MGGSGVTREPKSATSMSEPVLPSDALVDDEPYAVKHAADLANHEDTGNLGSQAASSEIGPTTYEHPLLGGTVAEALADPDPQGFQWGVIQALSQHARATAAADRCCFAAMLCQLVSTLQYELDDDLAFDDFVQELALARWRTSSDSLRAAAPVVGGFLARVISRPLLHAKSGATHADLTGLLLVANDIVRDSFERGGIRAWQSLPQIAENIASRSAQRGVSIGALTGALPRLRERLCPRSHEPQRRLGAASAAANLGEMQ